MSCIENNVYVNRAVNSLPCIEISGAGDLIHCKGLLDLVICSMFNLNLCSVEGINTIVNLVALYSKFPVIETRCIFACPSVEYALLVNSVIFVMGIHSVHLNFQ